jgi:hypothetical protein
VHPGKKEMKVDEERRDPETIRSVRQEEYDPPIHQPQQPFSQGRTSEQRKDSILYYALA